MPASVVIALTEPGLAESVARLLPENEPGPMCFTDSMSALTALEAAATINVLVTCLEFMHGQPNGVALARIARAKRPSLKVLFIGDESLSVFTDGLGALMPTTTTAETIAAAVIEMLQPDPPAEAA